MSIIRTINAAAEEKVISSLLTLAAFIYLVFFYINEYRDNTPYGFISKVFIIMLYFFIISALTALTRIITSIIDIVLYYITLPFCSLADKHLYNSNSQRQEDTTYYQEAVNTQSASMLFSKKALEQNKLKNLSYFDFYGDIK